VASCAQKCATRATSFLRLWARGQKAGFLALGQQLRGLLADAFARCYLFGGYGILRNEPQRSERARPKLSQKEVGIYAEESKRLPKNKRREANGIGLGNLAAKAALPYL
jgi:hypothetical protein